MIKRIRNKKTNTKSNNCHKKIESSQTNAFSEKMFIKNKKYIISLTIVLIGILSLLTGTSFALLKGNQTDQNEQIIKTGQLELKLTENYKSINKSISIMGDEDGLSQDETYEFKVTNTGSVPAKYDLKLVNEVPNNYTGSVLDTKYIKVGLEINGEEYGPISLEKVKNIIDSDIIYKNETINYKLRIWLDKSKESEMSKIEGNKAFLKIKAYASQRPESMDSGVVKNLNYTGKTEEYIVPRDGKYKIELWGASGDNSFNSYTTSNPSYGGYTSGEINLKAGEKLYFNVGGMKKTFNCCSKQGDKQGSGGATDVRVYDENTKPSKKYRYVRNTINGSSANSASHWVEIKVYDISGNVISKGKSVTYSGEGPHYGTSGTTISLVTDGDTTTSKYFGLNGVNPYVEVDLGAEYEISKVEVWHYFGDSRIYYDQKTELLTEGKKEKDTIYTSAESGTYKESSSGKSMTNTYLNQDLASRIMVAGGAGGSYSDSSAATGGHAGGLTSYAVSHSSHPIYSSNQTAGGAKGTNGTAGSFGYGGTNSTTYYNPGGGGYYGGGSGPGSGGGSSYISGHTGCVAVTSNKDITPKSGCSTGTTDNNCSIHYSNKKFTNTVMIDGAGHTWSNAKGGIQKMPSSSSKEEFYSEGIGQNGDGHARISLIEDTEEYLYTNKPEEYTAPKTGKYKVELWGASVKYVNNSNVATYQYGSYTSGKINLEENDKLYFYVGEMGMRTNTSATYNGGGSSSKGSYGSSGSQYYQNYPGGGATDVRLTSGAWNNSTSLASRIMVAAGAGTDSNGGGLTSETTKLDNSNCNTATCTYFAYGATQEKAGYGSQGSTAGSFGIGGNGEVTSSNYGSTGGGGGYYGGGGSYSRSWQPAEAKCSARASSGGSSYISGHTGCVAINSSTDITPKTGCTTGTTDNNCSIHYSTKKFINTVIIDGNSYSWTTKKEEQMQIPNPKGGSFDLQKGYPSSGYAKITFIN